MGRPEPDLHVAPGAPGVLAGIRADANGKPHATGKFLDGLPAGQTYPGSPDGARWYRHLGGDQEASRREARSEAARRRHRQRADGRRRRVRQLHPWSGTGFAQWVTTHWPHRGRHRRPGSDAGQRCPLRHAVPHRRRAHADPGTVATARQRQRGRLPDPDANNTVEPSAPPVIQRHYDDELLNATSSAATVVATRTSRLSTVHQIFHSEHNRLVDDENATLNANASLKADYLATNCASSDCTTHDPTSRRRSPMVSACSRPHGS